VRFRAAQALDGCIRLPAGLEQVMKPATCDFRADSSAWYERPVAAGITEDKDALWRHP